LGGTSVGSEGGGKNEVLDEICGLVEIPVGKVATDVRTHRASR
jgi:hypothetical protein